MLKVYCVLDAKVGQFLNPVFMRTDGEAIRSLTASLTPSHDFYRFAEDFSLYAIGTFDQSSGQFQNLMAPELVATALSLKVMLDKERESSNAG